MQLGMKPCRTIDLGCGVGLISEYIADQTGAQVTGLDYIPLAIQKAQQRTAAKTDRLAFIAEDLNSMTFPENSLDAVIAIDSLYFCADLAATVGKLSVALRPGGQMAVFYSHGPDPHVPKESFPVETLPPDRTPMAQALQANRLPFRTWDFTDDDYRMIRLRKQVLPELRAQFEAEDCMFIYENRLGEANGIGPFTEEGLYARYLYHVQLPD